MGSLLSLYPPAAPQAVGVSRATQTEWNCPVCRSVHSDAVAVPCGHEFCLGCLLRHTATSATCPLCASPVLSARFSALSPGDFLQCLLSPAEAPPGRGTWARRPRFRLVYTGPRPSAPQAAPAAAEPAGPDAEQEFPAELWAELVHGHEWLLEAVRPWLRHSLDTIYGWQWWEARQVETIALATLYMCGPDRAELTHMLQGYLGDYTAPLIHGLIHITAQGCREAWLRRHSQPAPDEERDEAESPAPSAGPSSLGGTPALGLAPDRAGPGLGNQPSGSGGPGRPPAAPAPAGQDRPRAGPEQDRPRAGPEQHGAWAGPEQDRPRAGPEQHRARAGPEQHRARAGPQEDAPAPGPSAPRRGRNRRPRRRVTGRSQWRWAYKSHRPFWGRRRKPRRK